MVKSILLLQMMDLLREQPGLTIEQLAGRLGRSHRTVYRYLESLSAELHVPVYCDRGGYFLAERSVGSRLDLAPKEVLAVRLALTAGALQKPGPFTEHALTAWQKIEGALTADTVDSIKAALKTNAVHVPSFSSEEVAPEISKCVASAVERNRRLDVIYRSLRSGETKNLIIDPYALVFRRHNWYIIAHSKSHGRTIQLKLVRVVTAKETGDSFQLPHDFSVDNYYAKAWEMWTSGEEWRVKVKFSARVAPIIKESKRHSTQKVEELSNGEIIFTATVSGLEEISFWILSYGADAEVLEPAELRTCMQETAEVMVSMYREGDGRLASAQSREMDI